MDFIFNKSYAPLYFLYGLAFFQLGVIALNQNSYRVSNFALIKYIRYLGYFGIVHGISEWVSMIIASEIYYPYIIELYSLKMFLKALSLSYLMAFGINILEFEGKMKKISQKLPVFLFLLWTMGFFTLVLLLNKDFLYWFPTYSVMSRYFIGLPAGIFAAIGLYKCGGTTDDLNFKGISMKYRLLSSSFISYSILSGVIVNKVNFFPANILNKDFFLKVLGFPVEIGRTALAILITFLFTKIIQSFSWEMETKILRLSIQQGVELERSRMGRELHDCIIQDLFATSLLVENLIDNEDEVKSNKVTNIKTNINGSITKIRDFIDNVTTKEIEINQLKGYLLELIDNFKTNYCLNIDLEYSVTTVSLGYLSSEKLTQIYYIVQEALSNIVKHADATKVKVEIKSTINSVLIIVTDNGKGFNTKEINKSKGYGLRSIKERTAIAEGILNIESSNQGTNISISIPWEEYENEF